MNGPLFIPANSDVEENMGRVPDLIRSIVGLPCSVALQEWDFIDFLRLRT